MPAVAFSNNDIAVVAFTFDRHLDGCLGFAIYQMDVAAGTERVLPGLARFRSQDQDAALTTLEAPIQKFWWKDLYAQRGRSYRYRIVAMGGKPGQLTPLAGVEPLVSNAVTLTADRAPFKAYFNRGIVASQAVIHALGDKADADRLQAHIADPDDDLRKRLMGQIYQGVTLLLDQADMSGGDVHAALYELGDPALEKRLQAADHGKPQSRSVILGNERVAATAAAPASEDADAKSRAQLKAAGVTVIDRILKSGRIPHNKFMVLSKGGEPLAVLTGSTNWTSSGLAAQTNNALVIQSPRVARRYLDYWAALKTDVDDADGDEAQLQAAALRSWAHKNNADAIATSIRLEDNSAAIEVMFSPNTEHLLQSPPREIPNDMQRLFDLVNGAKQAILFLAFDPGNNSILDAAGTALANNPGLFVRGALTSTQRAVNFREALDRDSEAEHGDGTNMHVAVVGEPGKPTKKGEPASLEPDYRVIPAESVTKDDAFGAWEAELYKYGHAIVHDKIVVIDPFSDNCTVITGSHNLGYRASHNNDENMVIIRGHKGLAQAYACHVLDVYDHYAWRYWLKREPQTFGRPLTEDDSWQRRYIVGADEKAPELRFWLSAASGGAVAPAPKTGGKRATTKAPGQSAKSAKSAKPAKSAKSATRKKAKRKTKARAKTTAKRAVNKAKPLKPTSGAKPRKKKPRSRRT